MTTIAWHAVRLRKPRKAYCELDDWSFDPRYTEGRCPICGWVAPDAPTAPLWLVLARRFEWELAGLAALLAVLVLLAVAVMHAAGYKPAWFGAPVHAAPVNGIASQSRIASRSPAARTGATPQASPRTAP